jgi:hypothetical protein
MSAAAASAGPASAAVVAQCDVARTPPQLVGAPVATANFMPLCGPVVRGPDWKWGDQDGGDGGAGLLLSLRNVPGWCWVRWLRNGRCAVYRIGGEHDLAFADAAAFARDAPAAPCPNAGCGAHLADGDAMMRHAEACPRRKVACRLGCAQLVPATDLDDHEAFSCPKRPRTAAPRTAPPPHATSQPPHPRPTAPSPSGPPDEVRTERSAPLSGAPGEVLRAVARRFGAADTGVDAELAELLRRRDVELAADMSLAHKKHSRSHMCDCCRKDEGLAAGDWYRRFVGAADDDYDLCKRCFVTLLRDNDDFAAKHGKRFCDVGALAESHATSQPPRQEVRHPPKRQWTAAYPVYRDEVLRAVVALQLDLSNAKAWHSLGAVLAEGEHVRVSEREVGKRECLVEALQRDPSNAKAWTNLSAVLAEGERVLVRGREVGGRECCIEALQLDPSDATASSVAAWCNLGVALAADERVLVRGSEVGKSDCFVKTLQRNPNIAAVWFNLGAVLAAGERVRVGGREVGQRECYVEALQRDPSDPAAWFNLGWKLAAGERLLIGGREVGRRECALEVLQLGYEGVGSWYLLGQSLGAGETATVDRRVVRPADCFVEVLRRDPSLRIMWSSLADALGDDETVTIDGVTFDKARCEARALECDVSTATFGVYEHVSAGYRSSDAHPFAARGAAPAAAAAASSHGGSSDSVVTAVHRTAGQRAADTASQPSSGSDPSRTSTDPSTEAGTGFEQVAQRHVTLDAADTTSSAGSHAPSQVPSTATSPSSSSGGGGGAALSPAVPAAAHPASRGSDSSPAGLARAQTPLPQTPMQEEMQEGFRRLQAEVRALTTDISGIRADMGALRVDMAAEMRALEARLKEFIPGAMRAAIADAFASHPPHVAPQSES